MYLFIYFFGCRTKLLHTELVLLQKCAAKTFERQSLFPKLANYPANLAAKYVVKYIMLKHKVIQLAVYCF